MLARPNPIAWHRTKYNEGGWTQWSPPDRQKHLPVLREPQGRVYFAGDYISGLAGWQVENLITRTADFYLEPNIALSDAAPALLEEVEKASQELQSEASLLFLPPNFANAANVWKQLGYEKRTIEGLNVRAWQEAARESQTEGSEMFFKQLRVDRVLRPM